MNKKTAGFFFIFRIWNSKNSCEFYNSSNHLFSVLSIQLYPHENRVWLIIWYLWKNLIVTRFLKGLYFRKFYHSEKAFLKCIKGTFIYIFKFFMPISKKKIILFQKNWFQIHEMILLNIYIYICIFLFLAFRLKVETVHHFTPHFWYGDHKKWSKISFVHNFSYIP